MEAFMKKLTLLLGVFLILASSVLAQVTLDPNQYVNVQIAADTLANGTHDPAKTVYKAESGQFYAFDGFLNCDFDLVIEGPDNTWIKNQTAPPVFLQIPAADGSARDMIHLLAGGSTRMKNIIVDGNLPNGQLVGVFVVNQGGYKVIFDNCAFGEIQWFTMRNQAFADTISYTNCVFVNMVRKASTPFNGMLLRIDSGVSNFIFENNTSINSSRLFGNGGNFFTSTMKEIHNTYLNMQVNGHELHYYEGLQANNIYYNWSYRGRNLKTNHYEAPFTTWDHYYDVATKLDSISVYEGCNLFYLDPAFPEYWNNTINPLVTDDSLKIITCFLWDTGVDTTITNDTQHNFTIGKNYSQFNPMFTNNPSKLDSMLAWCNYYWAGTLGISGITTWPDWRVQLVVDYDAESLPVLNWPPAFDLSYSNTDLQTAGTDGLPLGDLNWYPDAKATYLANRDAYIAALQDSMVNATWVYIPGDSTSAIITPSMVGVEKLDLPTPKEFYLANNYPNPFNPTTNIRFAIPVSGKVKLVVYNLIGQVVATLLDEYIPAGNHLVKFDAKDLPSGMYIYKLKSGDTVMSKKLMVLK
jgi:hypothetical protein